MKEKKIKICAVCGDTAIAKNFGALSCKSCKPFFRRNAFKDKEFKCKYEGKCQINPNTRKKCRKCRLDKCFAVGMKQEMILSDNQKHLRRVAIEENRKKKENPKQFSVVLNETTELETNFHSETSFSINSFETMDSSPEEETHIILDSDSGYFSEISLSDQNNDNNSNDELISDLENYLTITEVVTKSSDSYKETMDLMTKPIIINRSVINYDKNYTELEEYKFMELFQVFRPIFDLWKKYSDTIRVTDFRELLTTNNMFYQAQAECLINAVKSLNVYGNICENDRIALVKYSSVDILCLQSLNCYNDRDETFTIRFKDGCALELGMGLFKDMKNDFYVIYKSFLDEMVKDWDSDIVVLDLLTAIAFFNPNRPNLINNELVKVQQHIYLYLFQRYLTFKYRNKSESEHKSVKLLKILRNAHILAQLEKKYFYDEYQEQFSPLVKEIFES